MHMDFGTEDRDTPEAKWWKTITAVEDKIGSIPDLFTSSAPKKLKAKKPTATAAIPESTSSVIQVISQPQEEDSDDDEFTPYAAPDSDPSEGEEDAETINRNEPTAPIYLRDLLRFLRTHIPMTINTSPSSMPQLLSAAHPSKLSLPISQNSPLRWLASTTASACRVSLPSM
jgi:hypothetical protein